ncbi:MAG: globin domain-containing protein [Pseudomonadota bacterium]
MLPADDLALIRRTIDRLTDTRSGRDPFGLEFYAALFDESPELRALFREDFAEQGMRFLSTLRLILAAMDRPEEMDALVKRLGEGHRAYGVQSAHFAPMGRALRRSMAASLGARYDDATDRAWARAYDAIAERMRSGVAASPG